MQDNAPLAGKETVEEVEATLLALASTFEWSQLPSSGSGGYAFTSTANGTYKVGKEQRCKPGHKRRRYFARFVDWRASPYAPSSVEESLHFYKTSAHAKAACERHHATGKWE